MLHWKRVTLLGVAVAVAATGGTWTARHRLADGGSLPLPPASTVDGLVVDGLELGEMWESDASEATLHVSNPGSSHCELTDLRASCSCVAIEPKRITIPPGETREIRVILNLVPKEHEHRSRDSHPISLPIWGNECSADGKTTERYWVMRGQVKRVFRGTPVAAFARRSEREQPIPAINVPLETALDIDRVRVVAPPHFSASIQPSTEHNRWHLSVTPLRDLKEGVYEGGIVLEVTLKSGHGVPAFTVPASLSLVRDIEAVPDVIQTGNRDAGSVSTTRVELRSVTGKPFVVEQVRVSGSGLTALPVAGQERVRLVEHQIGSGASDGAVYFTVRPDTGDSYEVIVRVTGYGFAK